MRLRLQTLRRASFITSMRAFVLSILEARAVVVEELASQARTIMMQYSSASTPCVQL